MKNENEDIKEHEHDSLARIALAGVYRKRKDYVDRPMRKTPLFKSIKDDDIEGMGKTIKKLITRYMQKEKNEIFKSMKHIGLSQIEPMENVEALQDEEKELELELNKYLKDCSKKGITAARLQEGQARISVPWTGYMKDALTYLDDYSITLSTHLTSQAKWELTGTIQEGLRTGMGAEEIAREIEKLGDEYDGRGLKIARTEGMRAMNQGRLDALNKMGFDRVAWIASDLACEECAPYDGEIFDMEDLPEIPLHPNCRCTTAAVTRFTETDPDGERVIWGD